MTDSATRQARIKFVVLAFLFAAPVLGAYLMYFHFPEQMPQATTNYGRFFDPVRTLPEDLQVQTVDGTLSREPLMGKWTLLHWAEGDCGSQCEQDLILTRQTRASLNDKRERVRRLLVTQDPARLEELALRYESEHPDLEIVAAGDRLAQLVERGARGIVLLDPLGNVLMSYSPKLGEDGVQEDFKGIRKDLKKLLKLSNIG